MLMMPEGVLRHRRFRSDELEYIVEIEDSAMGIPMDFTWTYHDFTSFAHGAVHALLEVGVVESFSLFTDGGDRTGEQRDEYHDTIA